MSMIRPWVLHLYNRVADVATVGIAKDARFVGLIFRAELVLKRYAQSCSTACMQIDFTCPAMVAYFAAGGGR